jgi:trimethylamine:corrinoid methyltransferase-like protein
MKQFLKEVALFSAGGSVVVLTLCMLGGASHPHSVAGAVWRFIFVGV